jgi:hypothetical protein
VIFDLGEPLRISDAFSAVNGGFNAGTPKYAEGAKNAEGAENAENKSEVASGIK